MARGKFKEDLFQEVKKTLQSKERFGESKHAAKNNGTAKDGIYSHSTASMYHRECQRFAEYVAKNSPQGRHTSLREASEYAKDYIQQEATHKSPYTVKMERSALSKLFGVTGYAESVFGKVENRSRANIKRSRERTIISEKTGKEIKNPSSRAGHFSEKNHPNEVAFARGTGMRRSEMESVRGDQLVKLKDGSYAFKMEGSQCKGGKSRTIPIRGDIERIKTLARVSGHNKIFGQLPKAMDVHHYRSQYASDMYRSLARPVDRIPKKERYHCRGDLKGTCYDKLAMQQVTNALGHERISVIASNYLR